MKKILPVLLILFAACSVSRVDRYPGTSIPAFPEQLQGEYRLNPGGWRGMFQGRQLDSVRIRIAGDKVESLDEKGWQIEFPADTSSVISQLGMYVFLSKKDATEPSFWNTSVLWGNEKELFVAPINATEKDLTRDRLKSYLSLTLLVRKDNQAQIKTITATDKAMLTKLSKVSIDSKDSILYYQMNDARLLQFVKKEIGSKQAVRFTRIKQETPTK